MAEAGRQKNIHFAGQSRKFLKKDFLDFDLIVTMDDANRQGVLQLATSPEEQAKVRSFCSFVRRHPDPEVPDPYYGGPEGFDHVMDLMEDGCEGILEELTSPAKNCLNA